MEARFAINLKRKHYRQALYVGAVLSILQALDGLLTGIGIERLGLSAEGNPLLRSMMIQYGHIPTLAIVKALSIMIVILLTIYAQERRWVFKALSAISAIYLFVAIAPWTYVLFINPIN